MAPYQPGLWSVCAAVFADEANQQAAWQSFQDTLVDAIPGFVVERPVGVQLYGHLWQCLTLDMSPAATPNVPQPGPPRSLPRRSHDEDRRRVLRGLQQLTPIDRTLYVFAAVTGLGTERLCEITGHAHTAVSAAMGRATWTVHQALTS